MSPSRTHRPQYDAAVCLPCGTCTRRCPATVFHEQIAELDSLRGQVARSWPNESVNHKLPVPPCRAACPLGQDVPGYVRAVAQGEFQRASEIIYQTNPMPSVCGRLCLQACASACVRGGLEAPVAIRTLKRAAVELAQSRPLTPPKREKKQRVAVVGAGPAGLGAAFFLRRMGFGVTVFDARSEAGGLLRWAVPTFDLPRSVLAEDVQAIQQTGIELCLGQAVDGAQGLRSLLEDGFQAAVLAVGCGCGVTLPIPGGDSQQCQDVLSFARAYADGQGPEVKGPLAVVGSGHMALAAARLAVRAGAQKVHLIMSRSRAECSADPAVLTQAEREGVQILAEVRPLSFSEGQLVLGPVIFGSPDGVGRRWPQAQAEQATPPINLAVDSLVAAQERRSDFAGLARESWGSLRLAADGSLAGLDGVFAAGDVLSGPRNAIEALATGMKAATAVAGYCREDRS